MGLGLCTVLRLFRTSHDVPPVLLSLFHRSGFKLGTAGMVETATLLIYLALTHHGEGNKRREVVCAEKEGWEVGGGRGRNYFPLVHYQGVVRPINASTA